jgi:hypothetical protein
MVRGKRIYVTRWVVYGRRKDGERRRSDCLNRNGGVQETPLVLDGLLWATSGSRQESVRGHTAPSTTGNSIDGIPFESI